MHQGYGRGRRRGNRWVSHIPPECEFRTPAWDGERDMSVVLTVPEVECLRLVDVLGLTQEEAAMEMGVSRKTLWNDLKEARRKVALALSEGKSIIIRR